LRCPQRGYSRYDARRKHRVRLTQVLRKITRVFHWDQSSTCFRPAPWTGGANTRMSKNALKRSQSSSGLKGSGSMGIGRTLESRSKEESPMEMNRWERIKANIKTIAGAVLLAMFIRVALLEAFEIEGPSMEPTLLNGDRVVVAKFLFGLFLPFTSDA